MFFLFYASLAFLVLYWAAGAYCEYKDKKTAAALRKLEYEEHVRSDGVICLKGRVKR